MYTAFHFLMFALIGMGLVALVHWSVNNPIVRYALLPLFLAFEVIFYGLLEDQRARPLLGRRGGQHPRRGVHGPLPVAAAPRAQAFHSGDPAGGGAVIGTLGREGAGKR